MIRTPLCMLLVSIVAMTLSLQARPESLDLYWGGEPKDPRVQFLGEMQSAITSYSHDTLSVRTHIDSGTVEFNLDPLAVLGPTKIVNGTFVFSPSEQTSVAIFPSTLLSRIVPQFLIFDLPYLVRDHSHAMRVADQLTPSSMSRFTRRANLELIATLDGGFRELIAKHPVRTTHDLDGKTMIISHLTTTTLKSTFISLSDTPSAKYFSSLGMNILPSPTLPSFSLVFQAYAFRGLLSDVDVIDGQLETFPIPIENYNFKYITLTRHAFVPLFVVATRATWDRLSSGSKDWIRRAASEMQRESFEKGPTFEEATLSELKNQGVQESIGASPDFSYRGQSSGALQEVRSSFTFKNPDTVELLNAILRLAPRD